MRKLIFFLPFVFCQILKADTVYTTIYNRATSRPDMVNVISSTTLSDLLVLLAGTGTAGQCLQTDGGTPAVYSWGDCSGSPTPTVANFALLEDGTFLLAEFGGNLLLEH